MMRSIARFALLSPLVLVGGCPTTPDNPGGDAPLEVVASGPALAIPGEVVQLRATVTGDVQDVSYKWYQTYGRSVTLSDSTSPEPTFTAPSLATSTVLSFRVDARSASGARGSGEVTVALAPDPNQSQGGGTPGPGNVENATVSILTSKGEIVVELNGDRAPITVSNFLRYVDDGFYPNLIFHRVIKDFVVQGGGYDENLEQKEPRAPITLESSNGLKNDRGTIAMARTNEPNSATSQFYINVVDNDSLNYRDAANPGYAVFGKVVEGMDVVDEIAGVETESRGNFSDVPVEPIFIVRVTRVNPDLVSGR